jgi:phosphoribosylformylglycinamidine synthase
MSAVITPECQELLRSLNLTEGEYRKIVNNLGREPNFNELAMFSVLWSEHCCYKNSRHLLKKLPTTGERIVQGPGENAGVVDIGDGIQIAFKIESHNHPTAVEPYQGAATGVGGILRDIFTMNARPIACLNALRFGPIGSNARNRYLFTHAVKGIGDYGNCVGVPTIGGEVFFDEAYTGNPLVNAMALGVLYDNNVMPSAAKGEGNPILYVGSATGRDGMGGAAFASRELDEKSAKDRPAVQVGDPFAEKLLIEACLEAFQTGCVVAAQDMGAAGLTSSSCEMAAKGGVGIVMDLDKVPAREPQMKPFEYLLSESQERMLLVLEKGKEQPVLDVFAKWHLPAVVIGEVTEGDHVRILHQGETVVDLPVSLLTDLAPLYDRGSTPEEPAPAKALREEDVRQSIPDIAWDTVTDWISRMMGAENIAQPRGVFHQYDRHVQNNTLLTSDQQSAGVIRIRNREGAFSGKALAVTTDCNPRYVYLEPYSGTMTAVAEAARNLVSVGALPLAVTNNLNFGNPEKTEIYYQLYYSVEGMKDSCKAFQTPVTGGNVSLYNEFQGRAIFPTPVIGMVGLLESDTALASPAFRQHNHEIALVGRFRPTLGGSEYAFQRTGRTAGKPPDISLKAERFLQAAVRDVIQQSWVASVQDVSIGGLLVTLIESALLSKMGATLDVKSLQETFSGLRLDEILFGETNGTYLISYDPAQREALATRFKDCPDGAFLPIGHVIENPTLKIDDHLMIPLEPLEHMWRTTLALH